MTGVRISGRCDTYGCFYCGPRKTRRYVQAAAFVGPERMAGLTALPEDFQTARKQINDLRTRIRRAGYDWEDFWVIERNPKGTGYHAHLLQLGSFVPQRELQQFMGGRIVHIQAVRNERGAAGYVGKGAAGAAGYLGKGAKPEHYAEHLRLNGSRGAHWSRGYFPVPVGEVVREMFTRRYGDASGSWVRVPRE